MVDKTHWDCDKLILSNSFALAEGGGGVNGRVERDGTTGAVVVWLTILVDSCLLTPTPDSSGPASEVI